MESVETTPDINGFVEVKDAKIYYEYFGKKDKPVAIIFNGVAMETKSWYQFLPHATEDLDVLVWDYRGQGKSTSDEAEYSIEDYADYLKAIVDELQLDPNQTHLVGISSGTIVQAEFMRKYPGTYDKALMAGVILSPEKTFQLQNLYAIKTMKTDITLWVESLYCLLFSDYFVRAIEPYIPNLQAALNERYKDRVHALSSIMMAQNSYINDIEKYYPEYKKVTNDILVIAGEEDRITPTFYQKRVIDLFANVKYEEWPKVGHMIVMEKPAEFFARVKQYVL